MLVTYMKKRISAESKDTNDAEQDAHVVGGNTKLAGFGSMLRIPTSWCGVETWSHGASFR